MAAVLENPQISAPAKTVTFASGREELRLTKVSRYPVYGASGQKVSESIGEVVCFHDHRLEVPLEGEFVLEDGRTAPAAEIVEWLGKHRLLGDPHEGFFKVEMAAPAPTAEEMQALMDAGMALDVDRLAEIVKQEEAGWARPAILDVARGGIERIETYKKQAAEEAQLQAEQEAQDAEAAAMKAKPGPKPKAAQE
jgi:hypothetical protein